MASEARALPARSAKRSRKNATHKWTRWLHVYTSMISFIIVLFFGITGITLNHPQWTFGDETSETATSGTLPSGWDSDPVDFLAVTEYIRSEEGVSAPVADYSSAAGVGSVTFRTPGYEANLTFSTADGSYDFSVIQQGFVGVMNDLHKGRDSNSSWKWLIDVSGGFLTLVAVTGLGIQFFLKKRRRSAFAIAGVGLLLTIVFMMLTL